MRNIFLALVLANLAFAAWHSWYSESPSFPVSRTDATTPGLTLRSELTPDPADDRAASTTDNAAACLSFGPFPNIAVTDDLTTEFQSRGYAVRRRVAEGDVWLGHWVYLDGIASRAAASEIVATLARAGITEAYVITDDDGSSLISLGVFSQQPRAERRFAEARDLGFAPVVEDRTRPGTVYWLDVSALDGGVVAFRSVPDFVEGRGIELGACLAN